MFTTTARRTEENTLHENLVLARHAHNIGNYDRAEKYYTKVIGEIPSNSNEYEVILKEKQSCAKNKITSVLNTK